MLMDHLKIKYSLWEKVYYSRSIDLILESSKSPESINLKYTLESDDRKEYLRRFYKKKETKQKLPQLFEYFKYHYEIPRIFILRIVDIVDGFYDRKRHQIYHQVKQLIGKDNIVGDDEYDGLEQVQTQPKVAYSLLLKKMNIGCSKDVSRLHQEEQVVNDSLQMIVRHLNKLKFKSTGHNMELSEMGLSYFENKKKDFNIFIQNATAKTHKKSSTESKKHINGQNNFDHIVTMSTRPSLRIDAPLNMFKKRKPALVSQVSQRELLDSSPMKQKYTQLEQSSQKKAPKTGLQHTARKLLNNTTKRKASIHNDKNLNVNINLQQKKIINEFRNEITKFQTIHVNKTSQRNNPLFKSVRESRGDLGSAKSFSPKIKILGQSSSQYNVAQLMSSQPSKLFKTKLGSKNILASNSTDKLLQFQAHAIGQNQFHPTNNLLLLSRSLSDRKRDLSSPSDQNLLKVSLISSTLKTKNSS